MADDTILIVDSTDVKAILANIEHQFLSGVSPKIFLKEDLLSRITHLDELLNRTIYHPLNRKHPTKRSHQITFLKAILKEIETRNTEVDSRVYTSYLNLLIEPNASDEFHYIHCCIGCRYISVKARTSLISEGTTGLSLWQAGEILARYCVNNANKFSNKRILELGSGLGFTGISTIINCEPRYYCFTDTHDTVLRYMKENVVMNLSNNVKSIDDDRSDDDEIVFNAVYKDCKVSILNLSWERKLNKFCRDLKPDVILAADVTYDPVFFPSLCLRLAEFSKLNDAIEIILSCTIRNKTTVNQFFQCLHDHGLKETLVTTYEVWNSSYNQLCQVQIFVIF